MIPSNSSAICGLPSSNKKKNNQNKQHRKATITGTETYTKIDKQRHFYKVNLSITQPHKTSSQDEVYTHLHTII